MREQTHGRVYRRVSQREPRHIPWDERTKSTEGRVEEFVVSNLSSYYFFIQPFCIPRLTRSPGIDVSKRHFLLRDGRNLSRETSAEFTEYLNCISNYLVTKPDHANSHFILPSFRERIRVCRLGCVLNLIDSREFGSISNSVCTSLYIWSIRK